MNNAALRSPSRSVWKSASALVITVFSSAMPVLILIVTTPIYIRTIGLSAYGTLALIVSIVTYLQFLDFGIGRALNRSLAGKDQSSSAVLQLFSALAPTTAILITVSLATCLVIFFISKLGIFHGVEIAPVLSIVLPVSLLTISVVVTSICVGFLEAFGKFGWSNLILVFGSLLFNATPLLIIHQPGVSVAALVAFGAGARFAFLVPCVVLCWAFAGWRRPSVSIAAFRELIGYGGWVAAANIVTPLLETADRFVIGIVVGPVAAAYQAIVYNIVRAVRILPLSTLRVMFPVMARQPSQEAASVVAEKMLPAFSVLMCLACGWTMCLVNPFVAVWISPAVADAASPIASIMLFGLAVNSAAIVPYGLLQARGRASTIASLAMIEVFPYMALLVAASLAYGLIGAAMAWSARAIIDAIILFRLAGIAPRRLAGIAGSFVFISISLVASLTMSTVAALLVAVTTSIVLVAIAAFSDRDQIAALLLNKASR